MLACAIKTAGGPILGPPESMRSYRLPPFPLPGGLLPRWSPLGLPVVDGPFGGLPDPLDIGMLLWVCSLRRTRWFTPCAHSHAQPRFYRRVVYTQQFKHNDKEMRHADAGS